MDNFTNGGKGMSKKYLYYFSEGSQAFGGDKTAMRNTLGGKGSGLAEMTAAGMPVPQGFTITTEACTQYYTDGRQINAEIQADIFAHVKGLEEITGKKLGDVENPLLVSVRSGARQSMPGMMDTILNLGLNDASVEGLAKKTGNPRFAYDSYRRFVQMFADVVMGVSKSLFEEEIDKMKAAKGVTNDVDLDADDLKQLVVIFKKIYEDNEHKPFPQDPNEQLIEAVKAVFRSWDNPRANVYRKMNEIPYEWGTAVNVQQMAFGNSGDRSGTGVAFTRDPATGEKKLMGEYLINAQGEDVVAGVRTRSANFRSPSRRRTTCVPRARSATCRSRCPRCMMSSWRSPTALSTTLRICRTWSSPSRMASSTCSRPVTASAPRRPRCRSRATSSTRA